MLKISGYRNFEKANKVLMNSYLTSLYRGLCTETADKEKLYLFTSHALETRILKHYRRFARLCFLSEVRSAIEIILQEEVGHLQMISNRIDKKLSAPNILYKKLETLKARFIIC